MTKQQQTFKGQFSACAHYVDFRYWGFDAELTPELEELLAEEAEDRARKMLAQDYHSGILNCLYVDENGKDEEIRGWWEINTD